MSSENNPIQSSAYSPHAIEEIWYQRWMDSNAFAGEVDPSKKPYSIVMPPPNVTGRLHMGHALQDTIQDAITRIKRMQGFAALWTPGLDHAGIATQNVVEKTLKKEEGKNRHDLGREKFVERVWDWKDEYGNIILGQKKRLGVSCDWNRHTFTMDDDFSEAVQTVFVKLYKEGLVYRGNYLVNWCPIDQTAISDEEVNNVERNGHLWYVNYQLADGSGHIQIATTRPETMLGDSAIAVHPDDERYQHLIGKNAILPLMNREIPIIADEYVKMEFGAGALKITPGHDKNDADIGRKHNLPAINIMNKDATVNENGGKYEGMDRFDARDAVVADLDAGGFLVKVEEHKIMVPISGRSKAIIEPLVSRQWFVKMEPLAKPALEAVRNGDITFHPKRWENEYFRWLDNIRDWTISRQLWWGHRIPVWYYTNDAGEIDENRDFVVSVTQPEPGMIQDEDVLDTWFSSWLSPLATLGWPKKSADLDFFHPTGVLVSGYDILFFWIARMIMASLHFAGEIPFKDIFITGMIKDKQGRWMSKSLGNGIDPLDMIEQYGADAVRYSLTVLCSQGQDIKLDPLKFEMGRNFANKIWNAFNVFGRFVEEGKDYRRKRKTSELELVEKWMLHRLNDTIEGVNADIERFRLNEALMRIYDLFWGDFCDWYLEIIKPPFGETMDEDKVALALEIYEKMILMLHPFMPFITEELYTKVRPRKEGEMCINAEWPKQNANELNPDANNAMGLIQQLVSGMRNIKNKMTIPPKQEITALLDIPDVEMAKTISDHAGYFAQLAKVTSLTVGQGIDKPKGSAAMVVGANSGFIPLAGLIDLDVERERLQKNINQKEGFLIGIRKKLGNERFMANAPADVVARERKKESDALIEIESLQASLAGLE